LSKTDVGLTYYMKELQVVEPTGELHSAVIQAVLPIATLQ
jgi:hypothetical protein